MAPALAPFVGVCGPGGFTEAMTKLLVTAGHTAAHAAGSGDGDGDGAADAPATVFVW
jgi:hypothetical protein